MSYELAYSLHIYQLLKILKNENSMLGAKCLVSWWEN
jgi:hypothetical protein